MGAVEGQNAGARRIEQSCYRKREDGWLKAIARIEPAG
jgi:hypothetical protein